MSLPFDATLKDILVEKPADLQPAFGLPTIAPASPLNVDLSTITAATDIAFGYGDPLREIVDLNFQSGPDPRVPARLHLYNAAFHLKFDVPVRSVLVLLRPKAKTDGLNGKLTYLSGRRRVKFEYDGVKIMHESTAYDTILDEGRLEGEIRRSHRDLLMLGRQRFGRCSAKVEAAIKAVQDLNRLERMFKAGLTATSWTDIVATK